MPPEDTAPEAFPTPGAAVGPNILVVGDSCSGKTTLAATLASRLGLRHIKIDTLAGDLNWPPLAPTTSSASACAPPSPRRARERRWGTNRERL